jgi:sulfatase modifying factor 1
VYLDKSTFQRYHEELSLFDPSDFRIGATEASSQRTIRVCSGGNTDARLKGFAKMFNTDEAYIVREGFAAANSLIGYMQAQVVFLFFEDRGDYANWLEDGVELDFLQYNQPTNENIAFSVICSERLPLDEIAELLGVDNVFDNKELNDLPQELGTFEKPSEYIDSMVMVPTGIAPYQVEPTIVPQDARGMYFANTFIIGPEGCNVEGAVFYKCQRFVEEALNFEVGGGGDCSNIRRPLLVGQSLITQTLYESVMGEKPSYFKGSSQLPVDSVSWFDLLHFCNRLSEMEGFRPCYNNIGSGWEGSAEWDRTANGYRLLTEREWEYIARANRAFEYSGSDDPNEVAWYRKNSNSKTHPVGLQKENSFGTYDQSGNLWEWCWDRWSEGSVSRVLRGGNWYYGASYLRAAYRNGNDPAFQNNSNGGRLARTPDPLNP